MTFLIILFGILFYSTVHGYELDSVEANRIDVAPFYDTIIFSDVADLINEFESNVVSIQIFILYQEEQWSNDSRNGWRNLGDAYVQYWTHKNTPLDALISGSESDENLEDLLSEYQHYLDKAHKQKMNYLEKTKNKVPLIRHERYTKNKPGLGLKYENSYYNSYYNPSKVQQSSFNNPLFMPFSSKLSFYNKQNAATTLSPRVNHEALAFDKKLGDYPLDISNIRSESMKHNCYCKNGQYPCDCKCKECLIPFGPLSQSYIQNTKISKSNGERMPLLPYSEYFVDENSRDPNPTDNILNIRVKVDIQLPKKQDVVGKLIKNHSREDDNSKESTLNLPFPYFNFPVPMDLFGYRSSKYSKHDSTLHKIAIHKKKKSRQSNSNKKHRKKLITIHNLNIEPQQTIKMQTIAEENDNTSLHRQKFDNSNLTMSINLKPNITEQYNLNYTEIANKTEEPLPTNETVTEESIYLMVNMSNSDNGTEEAHRSDNSVETEYPKIGTNIATDKLLTLRKKRETEKNNKENSITSGTTKIPTKSTTFQSTSQNPTTPNASKTGRSNENNTNSKSDKSLLVKHIDIKKAEKELDEDTELLYWPNNIKNQTSITSKNITTIILDKENNKAKINMTKETIRHNRTRVLERAIFGDVNWDDVDTVAPVFLSFVGKYITGILTFCSQNTCHSMKCAEKSCIHRICEPNARWNQRGHCSGSNSTDSIASLESIMDLPSNIAFEIVDILQDKMLGKLFGKDEVYLNPWRKLHRPKIVIFKDGILSTKYVPSEKIVDLQKLSPDYKMRSETDSPIEASSPTPPNTNITAITEVRKKIIEMYAANRAPVKKIKVLTQCKKKSMVCRFLSCPNIKDHCILCEVKIYNSFHVCTNISTRYLYENTRK